jgi:hypothetical protein
MKLKWIVSTGNMSCAGLLTTKSGKKYFLKYSGMNSKGQVNNTENIEEQEWKHATMLRLFFIIFF